MGCLGFPLGPKRPIQSPWRDLHLDRHAFWTDLDLQYLKFVEFGPNRHRIRNCPSTWPLHCERQSMKANTTPPLSSSGVVNSAVSTQEIDRRSVDGGGRGFSPVRSRIGTGRGDATRARRRGRGRDGSGDSGRGRARAASGCGRGRGRRRGRGRNASGNDPSEG